jgi:hypothetical protein
MSASSRPTYTCSTKRLAAIALWRLPAWKRRDVYYEHSIAIPGIAQDHAKHLQTGNPAISGSRVDQRSALSH